MPVKRRPPPLEFKLTRTDFDTGKARTKTITVRSKSRHEPMLDLSESKLGNYGVKALADALLDRLNDPDVPPLRALNMDLFANSLGVSGAERLASAMLQGALPELQIVSLHSNKLGDDGVERLAPALKAQPKLRALTLARNEISDTGVAHLVTNLNAEARELSALKSLSLSYNRISNEGCEQIVTALISGASLRSLELVDLEHNEATGEVRKGEPKKRALADVQTTLRLKGEAEQAFGALKKDELRHELQKAQLDDTGDDRNELLHRLVRNSIEKEKAAAKRRAERAERALGEHPSLDWD